MYPDTEHAHDTAGNVEPAPAHRIHQRDKSTERGIALRILSCRLNGFEETLRVKKALCVHLSGAEGVQVVKPITLFF